MTTQTKDFRNGAIRQENDTRGLNNKGKNNLY